jgi:hypothetical protein
MKCVKTYLEPEVVQALDMEAAAAGVTRAEVIRRKMNAANPIGRRLSPDEYNAVVSAAQKYMHGSVDRRHVEALVAFTFGRLMACVD